jgi:hypothetical protein
MKRPDGAHNDVSNYRGKRSMADSEGMKPKDFISIGIAILALAVSTAGTWFNVLLQNDDLRVIIGDAPFATVRKNGDLELSGKLSITVVNSGNTIIGLTKIYASAIKLESAVQTLPPCSSEPGLGVGFEFKMATVRPNDIIVLNLDVAFPFAERGKKDWWSGERPLIISKKLYEAHVGEIYLACLGMRLVTTDGIAREALKPGYLYTIGGENDKDRDVGDLKSLFEKDQPVIMFQRKSSVLTR